MHVNIRGLRALLSRDGTHGFHQAHDSPGGLSCVVKQRFKLDLRRRYAWGYTWQSEAVALRSVAVKELVERRVIGLKLRRGVARLAGAGSRRKTPLRRRAQ